MTFRVHVAGLRELDAKFAELGEKLGTATLALALQQAAQPTVELARSLAPYDPDGKGKKHLRDSIIATTKLSRRQRRFVTEPGAANVFIGPTARHGFLVEFGHVMTVNRGRNKGRKIRHVPGYPFLRPAWDATREEVARSLREQLWRALLATAKGARDAAAAGKLDRRAAGSLGG